MSGAKLVWVALAAMLVAGSGAVVADLVSADDPDDISPIEIRKDDAGADVELVDDDEGDGDDTRGDRDNTRSDNTRGGGDTRSDYTAVPGAAPPTAPGPAAAPAHSDDGGYSSDG